MKTSTFLLLVLSGSVTAQYNSFPDQYNNVAAHIFFGRQPSTRAEAMGKGSVALSADAYSTFYNPAALGENKNFTLSLAYSSPFYYAKDGAYYFVGASYPVTPSVTIAASHYHYDFGPAQSFSDGMGRKIGKYDYQSYITTVSLAVKPIPNLFLGLNFNRVFDGPTDVDLPDSIEFQKGSHAYYSDLGLMYFVALSENNLFQVGTSLYNLNKASISHDELPQILRIGIAHLFQWNGRRFHPKLNTLQTILDLEYQDLINSKYYTTYRLGAEITALEMLSVRYGFYRQRQFEYGSPVNKDYLKEKTWGLGVQLPLNKLTQYPLLIKADMTSLQQPTGTKGTNNWSNFHSYSISLVWIHE